ncbi:BEL1-like homeodomain protein 1 [Rhododendron vialii]|uniref:BEL1-like homeodomain protein 1 n=1 Tax=Rhododendron vialii TaxID=182163 RepID=UPI00265D9040|nr:BEL1-like homeodomain protein 1 [Rhododendron vialii]XP_058196174.1 BEL1-like homeodomain protein 1 [Rhododendron vialii]XP_058196175.1 BEL1-like homeodomain protein 1 [Rhododendron vialii]
MATYFHGSTEIQADGLQTLYLMNPNNYSNNNNTEYSDTHQQSANNMLFLNNHNPAAAAAANALHVASISHAPPNHSQHFLGIPIPNVGGSANNSQEIPAQLGGILPRFHYNLWGPAEQTAAAPGSHPHVPAAAAGAGGSGENFDGFLHRPMVLSPGKQQGLSLTLSSQQPGNSASGGSSSVSNGIAGVQSVILGSKYLKAAQQLLDEVVKVGKSIKSDFGDQGSTKEKYSKMSQAVASGGGDDGSSGGESSSRQIGAELTTAQKQELQMKKAKLVSMLDEVEQRYRQYHHQMQIVVSSFEQAAGIESAKSYTALALQTISKQFRCLKDAITTQIKATSKSLGVGEDNDHSPGGGKGTEAGSRLKFVDHQIRQQRALQQLGMIQHNAWRPQRGLPERAVSVLRAWLFEHFLHPYPKDSDKHILAKQTGLTRSQVSNWFINARVRLWKPMVEEMYLEEIKDQEQNGSDHTKESGSKSGNDPQENTATFQMDQIVNNNTHQYKQEVEGIVQANPKKQKSFDKQSSSPSSILSMDMDMKMKPGSETTKGINHNYGSYSLIPDTSSHGNGFGAYPMGEIGRFDPEGLVTRYHGNSVSLTLGLPHCDNAAQQSYLPSQNMSHQLGSRVDMGGVETHYSGISVPQPSHPSAAYENRKFFAAQLLPDFVA